jgi:arginyl-tRNA synthetase
MTLREQLSLICGDAFEALGLARDLGEVFPCEDSSHGDFQCNGAMKGSKTLRKPPREIAAAALARIEGIAPILSASIAGPGFINLRIDAAMLPEFIEHGAAQPNGTAILDYGGPNIAKAMHVGHLRSSIIGESLKRILKARGWTVIGDVHLGDWGLPIGLLAAFLKDRAPDLVYFTEATGQFPKESPVTIDDLEVMYPAASARSKVDADFMQSARDMTAAMQSGHPGLLALWSHFRDESVTRLENDFASIGVTFDVWNGESSVRDMIGPMCDRLQQSGLAIVDDGALIVPMDVPDQPPFILRKSDGAALYSTTDLATALERGADHGACRIVYVVDVRQRLHFEQLFKVARIAGIPDETMMEHAYFGTMNGTDGKPFKTREGGVLKLSDLIATATEKATERLRDGRLDGVPAAQFERIARCIGIGAMKFADLSSHRETSYVFDIDRFISFEGFTGPYIQYMAVRMGSIIERARERGLLPSHVTTPSNEAERDLMLSLSAFPDAVADAARLLAPSEIAKWLFDTAKCVAKFYAASPVLSEGDSDLARHRLALAEVARRKLTEGLDLLGIEVPERM